MSFGALELGRSAMAVALLAASIVPSHAQSDRAVEQVVSEHVREMLPADGIGGAAVAVRLQGRTVFFNYGFADSAKKRPIASDTLFNLASLRKVFEATVLAQAAVRGELKLGDPVAKYVTDLQGSDVGRVTLGQLATHTSGLLLPQDHPPWPDWGYTLPEFIRTLNAWKFDEEHQPGRQHLYTHAGFVLLQLAMERALGAPMDDLIERRLLRPLGLNATSLPRRDQSPRGRLSPQQLRRAAQGYDEQGNPVGAPGDQQTYYHWPATGQMFSSSHDMALFLTTNLGELPVARSLRQGLALAQRSVWQIGPHNRQALAWEILDNATAPIVEKYGGLNNASTYIAMMPSRKVGIVILTNRGNLYPNDFGRRILLDLVAP